MSAPGTYALLLRLPRPRTIKVGALGEADFPPGWYLYIGSALGPGGLAARLARHRRRADKRLHWHIDYLRAAAHLSQIWLSSDRAQQECDWANAAALLPQARIILGRFGASDCRCASHLFHYPIQPELNDFASRVQVEPERLWVDDGFFCG